MRVELDLDSERSFSGRLAGPDGVTIPFSGRLELLSALERLAPGDGRERGAGSGQGRHANEASATRPDPASEERP